MKRTFATLSIKTNPEELRTLCFFKFADCGQNYYYSRVLVVEYRTSTTPSSRSTGVHRSMYENIKLPDTGKKASRIRTGKTVLGVPNKSAVEFYDHYYLQYTFCHVHEPCCYAMCI
jgi:hypothetical protein